MFNRGPKFRRWNEEFVRETNEQFITFSSSPHHRRTPIRAAYEDIHKVPKFPLLKDSDEYEFFSSRSRDFPGIGRIQTFEGSLAEEGLNIFPELYDEVPTDHNQAGSFHLEAYMTIFGYLELKINLYKDTDWSGLDGEADL